MLSSSGAAEPRGIPFPGLLGQPGGHRRSHPARRGSEAGPASAGAQPGAARKEAGARGRGEVPAWLPGAGEGVGEEHAGPGACVGTAGLPRLTRGRKRGSCTAACPSWSRTSSLPGWSGRSGGGKRRRSAGSLGSPPTLSPSCSPAQHRPRAGSEALAQSEVGKNSWTQGPRYSPRQPPASTRGEKDEADAWLTAQTKQVSCQLKPSASRNRSPASILKSQPRHLVPNIFS